VRHIAGRVESRPFPEIAMGHVRSLGALAVAAALLTAAPLAAQQKTAAARRVADSAAAWRREAKVTEHTARATALATVPGGTVRTHELEREKGRLIYSYDIAVKGKPGVSEVQVDAVTGKVVAREHESAAKEREEARTEGRREAAKPAAKKGKG
jgi:uncharacterized membrane protein YkoI